MQFLLHKDRKNVFAKSVIEEYPDLKARTKTTHTIPHRTTRLGSRSPVPVQHWPPA